MRGASVFVLPCVIADDGDRDGIPVVLMEAMAVGVPCVSSDFPAIRELIEDGVSGRLIAPADVKELARAIEGLIWDSSLRARICCGGKEAVSSEFSTRLNGHRLLDVFQGEREVVA
jgi:glycosyltransferase involved in cell wall biosynthesis